MKELYTNYISLGYFCEVAQDLEKLGLRNFSSPFDWITSYFPGVIDAVDKEFDGFFSYENLSQNKANRYYYHEDKYNFTFFHDFDKYKTLDEQYENVKEKYRRRIGRFLNSIKEPTLFIRYISDEELDKSGHSKELKYIEENYRYILNVLKRYNAENDIIFIGNESLRSDSIEIYHVPCDKEDRVSRTPIFSNKELYSALSSVPFPGKKDNQLRYKKKARKKRSLITKLKRKTVRLFQILFMKEYIHDKTY